MYRHHLPLSGLIVLFISTLLASSPISLEVSRVVSGEWIATAHAALTPDLQTRLNALPPERQALVNSMSSGCQTAFLSGGNMSSACASNADIRLVDQATDGQTGSLDVNTGFVRGFDAGQQAAGLKLGAATKCSIWSNWSFTDCIFDPLLSSMGSWFLTAGAYILLLAGKAFDMVVKLLVTELRQTLESTGIMGGIREAWRIVRDFANIAIIGIFVFIAIMTILNNANYGAKKLIARVLIIAVLINFSFLFTSLVVETSNIASTQFQKALQSQTASAGTAESFLKLFGLEEYWHGTKKLTDVVKDQNGGVAAFFYGLFGFLLLLGIAFVLLYGTYVVVARALLLVFALITSSLAFATYLLPIGQRQAFIGWDNWWSNLLKAALFGPLLMIFLNISMLIMLRAQEAAKGSGIAIRDIAANPAISTDATWKSLIGLALGTGFLFISIKAASSFASKIGGWGTAAAMTGIIPAAIGMAGGGAARLTMGAYASRRLSTLDQKISAAKDKNDLDEVKRLSKVREGTESRARSDFNVMNTRAMDIAMKSVGAKQSLTGFKGLDSLLAGKTAGGGILRRQEEKAKVRSEATKGLMRTDADKTAAVGKAREEHDDRKKEIDEKRSEERENARITAQQARTVREAAAQEAVEVGKVADPERNRINKEKDKEREDAKQGKQVEHDNELASASPSATPEQTAAIKARHQSEMNATVENIEKARKTAFAASPNINRHNELLSTIKEQSEVLKDLAKKEVEAETEARKVKSEITKKANTAESEVLQGFHAYQQAIEKRVTGLYASTTDQMVVKELGIKKGQESVLKRLQKIDPAAAEKLNPPQPPKK